MRVQWNCGFIGFKTVLKFVLQTQNDERKLSQLKNTKIASIGSNMISQFIFKFLSKFQNCYNLDFSTKPDSNSIFRTLLFCRYQIQSSKFVSKTCIGSFGKKSSISKHVRNPSPVMQFLKIYSPFYFCFKLRAKAIHQNYNRPTQCIRSLHYDNLKRKLVLLEIENSGKKSEKFYFLL